MEYEVYPFRPPDDVVVFAPVAAPRREISLLKRRPDGRWHCALCGTTACRHTRAVEKSPTVR